MYFFYSQITAAISNIEKSTQRDLYFNFDEFSKYVNFFCLITFPSQKKLLVNELFKRFYIGNEASPVFVIIYFQILCFNTDMAKKPITWMTIIGIKE